MATNTISTAAGDGGLRVTVNEFGEFSSGQALYDPLGAKTSASTTYRSYVALGVIGSDGNTSARNALSGLASFNGAFTDGNNSTLYFFCRDKQRCDFVALAILPSFQEFPSENFHIF